MADYQQFGQQPARGFAPFGTMPAFGNDGTVQGGYVAPSTTPAAPTDAATGPTPFQGSSLDTLYGVDSESFLSDDQRKLARQIQGKFDASMNRRDRELQRYAAPRLSSFVEDEALARATALARGLNGGSPDGLGMVRGSGPASRGGGGSGGGPGGSSGRAPTSSGGGVGRAPAAVRTTPPGATPSQAAKWQQIMGGLSSILPLLIGKSGMDGLMKDGLAGWLKNKWHETFPEASGNGTDLSDEMLDRLLDAQDANGSWDVLPNPNTNVDMYGDPQMGPPLWDDYTPGADLVGPPELVGPPAWDGWDPGAAVDTSGGWWGDSGDFYYPDAGSAWDEFDPYALGGW